MNNSLPQQILTWTEKAMLGVPLVVAGAMAFQCPCKPLLACHADSFALLTVSSLLMFRSGLDLARRL